MSSITDAEKLYFESAFRMDTGWVLDYNDASFGALFRRHQIDIHGPKYQSYGTSKAKKLRAFWEKEDDTAVATVLIEMLDTYVASCAIKGTSPNDATLGGCRDAVARLNGSTRVSDTSDISDIKEFLRWEFSLPAVEKLPVEPQVATIIEARLQEAQLAFAAGAYLSVIFQCGSVLEGVLLGAALMEPSKFNQSASSPKPESTDGIGRCGI